MEGWRLPQLPEALYRQGAGRFAALPRDAAREPGELEAAQEPLPLVRSKRLQQGS